MIGLGNKNAVIHVYIQNIPPLEEYQKLANCRPMQQNEINAIVQSTGNHWRKIFNVYAKLIFQLQQTAESKYSKLNQSKRFITVSFKSWQDFRDNELLQKTSEQCL